MCHRIRYSEWRRTFISSSELKTSKETSFFFRFDTDYPFSSTFFFLWLYWKTFFFSSQVRKKWLIYWADLVTKHNPNRFTQPIHRLLSRQRNLRLWLKQQNRQFPFKRHNLYLQPQIHLLLLRLLMKSYEMVILTKTYKMKEICSNSIQKLLLQFNLIFCKMFNFSLQIIYPLRWEYANHSCTHFRRIASSERRIPMDGMFWATNLFETALKT